MAGVSDLIRTDLPGVLMQIVMGLNEFAALLIQRGSRKIFALINRGKKKLARRIYHVVCIPATK